jgi:hypothetical protein
VKGRADYFYYFRRQFQKPMSSVEPKRENSGTGIKYEMIVAIAAILIGVATLFVYLYQARIMREQQRASVWPYVEWTLSLGTQAGFDIRVNNKGVGPAIIRSVSLKLDGKPMDGAISFMNALLDHPDSLAYGTTSIDGTVLAPGEEVHFLQIAPNSATRKLDPSVYDRISLQITYSSIYNDCWVSNGKKAVETECP